MKTFCKSVLLIVIVSLSVISTAGLMTNYFLRMQQPSEVIIVYDSTDEVTLKATAVLEDLLSLYILTRCMNADSLPALIQTSKLTTQKQALVYAFHGNEQGLQINSIVFPWTTVATEVIESSAANYHFFLACHSENLPLVPAKYLFAQTGDKDYVLSALSTANLLAQVLKLSALSDDIVQKIAFDRVDLFLRSVSPLESLWAADTHNLITEIALDRLYAISWVKRALSASTITNTSMKTNFVDPDNEGLATGGGRNVLSDMVSLVTALANNPQLIEETLWHVSFKAHATVNVVVPAWYATSTHWNNNQILIDLDNATTGGLDGQITLSENKTGLASSRISTCYTTATAYFPRLLPTQDFFTNQSFDYPWMMWLSRAAHFLQDQANPFHTALVDNNDQVVEQLTLDAQFNAREVFVCCCTDEGILTEVAEYIYDNHLQDLYVHDFGLSYCLTALGSLPVWFLVALGIAVGGAAGIVISAIALGVAAVQLANAGNAFKSAITAFQTEKTTYMTNLKTNFGAYNVSHGILETHITNLVTGASTKTAIKSDLESYLNNYLANSSDSFAISVAAFRSSAATRQELTDSWASDSRYYALIFYPIIKNTKNASSVESDTMKLLRKSTIQTIIMFKAYFEEYQVFTDSDGDGFSDILETTIFGSSSTSGTRDCAASYYLTDSYEFLVFVTAKTGIPCQSPQMMQVEIGYKANGIIYYLYSYSYNQYELNSQAYGLSVPPLVDVDSICVRVTFKEYHYDGNNNLVVTPIQCLKNLIVWTTIIDNPLI